MFGEARPNIKQGWQVALLSFQSTQSIQSSNESANFYNGKNENFDLDFNKFQ